LSRPATIALPETTRTWPLTACCHQWAINHCLAQIGIEHAEHRARAIAIGERLEVLKDYPTPPNCTSPFAPIWITEMVRRQHVTVGK
jgi:hypothetical protein